MKKELTQIKKATSEKIALKDFLKMFGLSLEDQLAANMPIKLNLGTTNVLILQSVSLNYMKLSQELFLSIKRGLNKLIQ